MKKIWIQNNIKKKMESEAAASRIYFFWFSKNVRQFYQKHWEREGEEEEGLFWGMFPHLKI